jgi:hypothetical protein
MNGDTHGPFDAVKDALAKIDELDKAGIKARLSNNIVKGTAKYHKRGWLRSATFEWTVTVGEKPIALTEETLGRN